MSFWVGLGCMIWMLQSLGDQILIHSLFKIKKIQLIGLPLRFNDISQKKNKVKEGGLNIISPRELDKEICEESVVFVVVAKEILEDFRKAT